MMAKKVESKVKESGSDREFTISITTPDDTDDHLMRKLENLMRRLARRAAKILEYNVE